MSVFDRAHFAEMTAGDADLQAEVLGLFRGQIAAWRSLLSPGENWRDAVHTIKGSARGIGLGELAAACEAAEAAQGDDDSSVAGALAAVNAALDAALKAIDAPA